MSEILIETVEQTCRRLEKKASAMESATKNFSQSIAALNLKFGSLDGIEKAISKERHRLKRETAWKRFAFASAQKKSNFD
ncbi:MAG: hypothetical protein ACI89J_003474 [Hyphomicrobiaceae bacterium]|jgi:hypothetical protein